MSAAGSRITCAEIAAAAHHGCGVLAEERSAPGDVDRDGGRPVRLLIPRQQVPGQREAQDDQEEHDACHPRHLARRLVRPEQDDAQHVDDGGNDDEAGAEEMQAADDAAKRHALADVADAVVRVIRRRHVVHRQDHPRDELDAQQEEQDAAGDEPPAHARGQRLVEQVAAARAIAGPGVEPVEEGTETAHQS
jgi:hypothetical protein